MDARLRALNRFGLGARIGEIRSGADTDPRAWLRDQARPERALLPAYVDVPSLEEIGGVLTRQREAQRSQDAEERQAAQRSLRELMVRESTVALTRRITSDAPFVERLVAFWSNHLCVSAAANPVVAALAGHYERSVVRPHVLGRFEDMLLASARHPAMLVYLDNARSVGPESRVGRATARRGNGRGLNENYARELLELHTLGVDGGYGQEDVEAAARVLTGWSVDLGAPPRGMVPPGARRSGVARRGPTRPGTSSRGDEGPGFVFRTEIHEPGSKTLLGRRYGPGGADEGETLIRTLARHPSTARFLATKLARHFVADDPPPDAVARLESAYRDTQGDLAAVSRAVVDLDDAWDPSHRKLRTPQEWLVASLRALQADRWPPALLGTLRELRHPLWAPQAPKGFDDVTRVWADPDSLMNRAELARSVARRIGGMRRARAAELDPRLLLQVVEPDDEGVLAGMLADSSAPEDERVALALGGPAFQWR